MPPLTRWFIRASFISLILGVSVGAWQQVPQFSIPGLFPAYLHLLTFGWLTQLIFGIANWMFPKYTSENPRGYAWLGWLTFIFLNLGLILRVVFEPLNSTNPTILTGWFLVAAASFQWISGLLFFINTWKRIKEK